MTRDDFVNNVTTWDELIDFCYDGDCQECDDIVNSDGLDGYIDDVLNDLVTERTWRDLRDILADIPTHSDWYMINGDTDIIAVDDGDCDFNCHVEAVLEWADRNEIWDEVAEQSDASEDAEYDSWEVDDELSVSSLLTDCSRDVQVIEYKQDEQTESDEQTFENFLFAV